MTINKYILAAMLSAGLLGTAAAQDKTTTVENNGDYKLKETESKDKTELQYKDKDFKAKEKVTDNEVKVKSKGDPTKFNEIVGSSQTGNGSDSLSASASGDNYYPSRPVIEIINGSTLSIVSIDDSSASDASASASAKNSQMNENPSSDAVSPVGTLPKGNLKYKQKGDKTTIKENGDKLKENDKTGDLSYKSKDGKTVNKETKKETYIKEPGAKEVITKDKYTYDSDSVNIKIKEKK
jgi:hypothetical protein